MGYTASATQNPNWVEASGVGSGEITASSQNVTVEGNAIILEGDASGTITINGMELIPGSSSPTPTSVTDEVKITDAGQSKCKAS